MTLASTDDKLWTKDLVLAFVANFFVSLDFYLLMTTMALYAVERFAVADATSGLASSMFIIGAVLARLVAGNLVDLAGRRRVLLVSLVVFVAASFCYLPAGSVGVLLAVRGVHGVAFGFASTAAMAIAQSIIPLKRRAEGTGYFTLSNTLATAIGPSIALVLVHGPGYDALFAAGIAAGVLALGAALFLRTPDRTLEPEERARLRRFHPRDLLHPAVLPIASVMLAGAVGYSGIIAFLNSYAREHALESGASMFFVVYAVVLFGARLFVGRLQDRRGENVVVHGAIVAFALGLAALGLARTDALLVIAGGLCGLGFGTLMSALQAVAVSKVPTARVGVAISTHLFMVDLGVGLGPVALGALLGMLDLSALYLVLAALVAASALTYHLVHGRKAGRRAPQVEVVSVTAGAPERALADANA